jgi:CSLREA domain-containing protein
MRTLEVLGCTLALASALAGNAAAQEGGTCGPDPCDPGRTLVVNSFDDLDDDACDSAHCSLREAIGAANEDELRDTILFAIPWQSPEIGLHSPLPVILEPLVIDGSGQPDVAIDARDQGDALRVYAGDTVIRGLTILVTNGAAIRLSTGTGARVEGNVLMGQGGCRNGIGILIEDATGLVIGGSEPGQGNRILCVEIGIQIHRLNDLPDGGDRIEGNEILDTYLGVLVQGSYFTLGGFEPGSANAIRGYRLAGMVLEGGFFVDTSVRGVAVLGNSMLSAGGIGIDLSSNGRTANDAWDADQGANGLQNFPVLTSAEAGDGIFTVAGTLHSTPLSEFRIELFASAYPESGERLLGVVEATSDPQGDLAFELTGPSDLTDYVVVSATATNLATRETSELSDLVFIAPRDRDGDGVPNGSDLCPDTFDPEQLDGDGDGVGDACDAADDDVDRDQVRNELDNCPELPNPDQANTDGDGAGDACDADDDDDGLSDGYESANSCLSALVSDAGDDSDGDGLSNAEEFGLGSDPCNSDSDGDGLPDGVEVFGLGPFGTDPLDPDSDDDGALDGDDNCPRLFYEETGGSGSNPAQADLDEDGRGDVCDPDDDGDGLSDSGELGAGTSPLDPDSDDDGALDGDDNCPRLFYEQTGGSGFNPDQADLDQDGRGDVCDLDDDGDGLPDADELAAGTNPLDADTDGDGHGDPADACPVLAPAGGDADANGCTDTLERLVAIVGLLDLEANLERALLSKLDEAAAALARGNERPASRKLADFVSLVEAKRGRSIGEAEADLLVAYATNLIAQLESGGP